MSYPDIEIAIEKAVKGDLSLIIERVRQLDQLCRVLEYNGEEQRRRAETAEAQLSESLLRPVVSGVEERLRAVEDAVAKLVEKEETSAG